MTGLRKYPRTPHLTGSRLSAGDEDLKVVGFDELAGRRLVIEEKLDGSNTGISFTPDGELRLQSRGHYLLGGDQPQFALFKQWGAAHAAAFRAVLGFRYLLYGEWLYACHTIFYDRLPHYFLEYDVYDREREVFLNTPRRRELLAGLPLVSAPVLGEFIATGMDAVLALRGPSRCAGPAPGTVFAESCRSAGIVPEVLGRQIDCGGVMEGLYIKAEDDEIVTGRYKWVRGEFTQTVQTADSHWSTRPIVANCLRPGTDIFAGAAP